MHHPTAAIEFCEKFEDLVVDQAKWSQQTFGTDQERSCLGALLHLEKEAIEAQMAFEEFGKGERLREELADCFLLILDASRRAGIKPQQLIEAAQVKMAVNRDRKWPKPTSDAPVEHVR